MPENRGFKLLKKLRKTEKVPNTQKGSQQKKFPKVTEFPRVIPTVKQVWRRQC